MENIILDATDIDVPHVSYHPSSSDLIQCLMWLIENDETNVGPEWFDDNKYWIDNIKQIINIMENYTGYEFKFSTDWFQDEKRVDSRKKLE